MRKEQAELISFWLLTATLPGKVVDSVRMYDNTRCLSTHIFTRLSIAMGGMHWQHFTDCLFGHFFNRNDCIRQIGKCLSGLLLYPIG